MGDQFFKDDDYVGRCFVIQPFDGAVYDRRYKDVFEPAIRVANFEPYRVDEDPAVDIPIEDIEKGINDSLACFAEISTDNPNVWYELGYAASAGKPICLVCSNERQTPFPFDVRHRKIIKYDSGSPSDFDKLGKQITERLAAILKKQGDINGVLALKPTMQSDGLTSHEIAAMALIISQFETPGVSGLQLKADMKRAGYTAIAAGIAIEKLNRGGYVFKEESYDPGEGTTSVWGLTIKGREWLLQNEDKLSLRIDWPETDIPF